MMSISADTLRRLAALHLPAEALSEVLSIIADVQSAGDARKAKDRERKSLYGPDWSTITRYVFERDGLRCAYCGAEDGRFVVDHIHPISKGGANTPDNLCVACGPCNSSKRDRSLDQWSGRK
jgi:hypothetical protein